jgi:hypothetical protein
MDENAVGRKLYHRVHNFEVASYVITTNMRFLTNTKKIERWTLGPQDRGPRGCFGMTATICDHLQIKKK